MTGKSESMSSLLFYCLNYFSNFELSSNKILSIVNDSTLLEDTKYLSDAIKAMITSLCLEHNKTLLENKSTPKLTGDSNLSKCFGYLKDSKNLKCESHSLDYFVSSLSLFAVVIHSAKRYIFHT